MSSFNIKYYGVKVNQIYAYPNGIVSINENLEKINNEIESGSSDFAKIIVPYYKGKGLVLVDE